MIRCWDRLVQKLRRTIAGGSPCIVMNGAPPDELTAMQTMFVQWNAERLDISLEKSRERFFASLISVRGGHASSDYRTFNDLSYQLFQVFFNDSEKEIYDAYRIHAPMHFLRMLSYSDSKWYDDDIIVQKLNGRPSITILDYGCGLAQKSRAMAEYFKGKGVDVNLFLADIPTIRKEFLIWLGKKAAIETTFLDCTATVPIPKLPQCDICFALEFFEHVYEPLLYVEAVHSSLKSGGILVTNISDHQTEFMHVSPCLKELRDRLQNLSYDEIDPYKIYQKKA